MKTVMNNRLAYLVMGLSLSIPLLAQIPTYNISTLLGSYSQTDTSVAAPLLNPLSVAVDGAGNVYFTDTYNNRVRRIDAVSGAITTIAGDGTFGVNGQNLGGPAVKAKLWQPAGLVFDAVGNLYIADSWDHVIEKVDTTGAITLFAGTSNSASFNGDGGPAASLSRLRNPQRLAVDGQGNLYIADKENNRIRKVTTDGIIHTVAGIGGNSTTTAHAFSGDGGPAVLSGLGQPQGVAVDSWGNIYIADTANNRIRMVQVSTASGSPLTDSTGKTLTDNTRTITTVVGGGTAVGGDTPLNVTLSGPAGLAIDSTNNVYIADTGNGRILYLNNYWSSCTTTLGATTCSTAPAISVILTGLSGPAGIALNGNELYIAESSANRIRQFDIPSTNSTILAQGGSFPVLTPHGLAVDASGNVFVADTGNQRIGKIPAAGGSMAQIAGLTGQSGFPTAGGDENPFAPVAALSSKVSAPWGGAFDALGNYYFADRGNNRVRMISPTGNITTVAGGLNTPVPPTASSKPPTVSTAAGYFGDGLPAIQAGLRNPSGVAVDNIGGSNSCPVAPCIYIADSGNNVVRQVNANGIISTFAGIAPACATAPTFSQTTTTITTVQTTVGAGSTTTAVTTTTTCAAASGSDGDGLLATQAQLSTPLGVAVDGKGNVYIADTQNHSIRAVNAITGILTTPVGVAFGEGRGGETNLAATPPVTVLGENTTLDSPVAIASDAAGNLYWAEGCNTFNAWGQCETSRIRRYDAATKSVASITGGTSAQLGTNTFGGDGGAALKSLALIPTALAIDSSGNVYFADFTNRVRKLTPIPASQ